MSHVVRQVQLAKRHGMTVRRTRIPVPKFPIRIEEDYAHRIVGLVNHWKHAAQQLTSALPVLLRRDAAGDDAHRIMGRIRGATTHTSNDTALASLASDYGGRVAGFQKQDVLRQARAALGVDLALHDPRLAGALSQFVHENVVLIRNLHGGTLDKLEALIHRGISTGMSHEEIGELISKRFGIAERGARFIARDQVARLNSKVTELRHAELGIREFDWWSMQDGRVRRLHRAHHGRRFAYHDPPSIGLPGNTSDGPACRCGQRPVWSSVQAEVEVQAGLPAETLAQATRIGVGMRVPG